MKHDEFAFFNQQLAGMLKSGIPLEGALRQLCSTMKRGRLRGEFEKLGGDLARGVPLDRAIGDRALPELYVRMVRTGAKSNDLPGMLNLVADHYHRVNSLSTRLKGLMIYPAIVLVAAVSVSIFIAFTSTSLTAAFTEIFSGIGFPMTPMQMATEGRMGFLMFLPTVTLCLLALVFALAISVPALRNKLRWKVSGFKEASLANFAATVSLMLRQGVTLSDALALIQTMEGRSPLGDEVARWREGLAAGRVRISDLSQKSKIIPPLFVWMVGSEGENWTDGFRRAAEIYHARAVNKADMLLFAALPVSVLALGIFVVGQVLPLVLQLVGSMASMLDSGFSW